MDNFSDDPLGGHAMLQTAENVAAKRRIATAQQHDVLMREQQYRNALTDGCAFQTRYMSLPFEVADSSFGKTAAPLESDDGIRFSSAEGLANLKPVLGGGTATYGGQTHPADGNAAIIIVADPERAVALSANRDILVWLHGFGSARAALAHMPEAPIPAARQALEAAGVSIERLDAVKTHNPFASTFCFRGRPDTRWRRGTISAARWYGAIPRRRWATGSD